MGFNINLKFDKAMARVIKNRLVKKQNAIILCFFYIFIG